MRQITRTSIVKTPGINEWHVKAYDEHDARMPDADYFASDPQDARDTAAVMVEPMRYCPICRVTVIHTIQGRCLSPNHPKEQTNGTR